MIGYWIQPWPGEAVLGEVVAISGNRVLCRCRGGMEFSVEMAAITPEMIAERRLLHPDAVCPARLPNGYAVAQDRMALIRRGRAIAASVAISQSGEVGR